MWRRWRQSNAFVYRIDLDTMRNLCEWRRDCLDLKSAANRLFKRLTFGLPGLNFSLATQLSSNCVNWSEDVWAHVLLCCVTFSEEYPAQNWIWFIKCNCFIRKNLAKLLLLEIMKPLFVLEPKKCDTNEDNSLRHASCKKVYLKICEKKTMLKWVKESKLVEFHDVLLRYSHIMLEKMRLLAERNSLIEIFIACRAFTQFRSFVFVKNILDSIVMPKCAHCSVTEHLKQTISHSSLTMAFNRT